MIAAPVTYTGAFVRRITEVLPHPNADRLDIAMLGKFQTVVPKGAHAAGDLVVFIEADTVLPTDEPWADEYRKYAEKRVKIVKLRGAFSEGIVAPLDKVLVRYGQADGRVEDLYEGLDVSPYLRTTHYSPPILEPGAIGPLPAFLPKTDEERWEKITALPEGDPQYTLKVDGQSVTFLWDVDGGWRVFGRTLEYPADPSNKMGALLERYRERLAVLDAALGMKRVAFRGEAYGEGIQNHSKNLHSKVPGRHWILYGIYDLDERRYLDFDLVKDLSLRSGVPSVPLFDWGPLTDDLVAKIQEGNALKESYEGIVVKYPDGSSFKILNKAYDSSK